MRIIKVLGVVGSRACLLAAVTAFGCDDESSAGGDDVDAGLEADESEGASDDGDDETDTDDGDTDDAVSDDADTDDADEPTDDDMESVEPGETDDAPEADAGSDPNADDDAQELDAGAADDEPSSDDSDDEGPAASDDLEVDDESTDEAETDEVETDETETDEAETDEAETDEAETDEVETDETETDPDPTPVDVRVANFSLVQTRSEMYISGIDPIVITGSGASAMFYHFEFVEEDAEPQPDPCETVSVGDCSVSFCPESEAEEGEGLDWTELVPTSVTFTGLDVDPIETEHKSMIEIVSGSAPEQLETLVGFNAYDTVSYWSGGETARIIVAASDEVPAFDLTFEPPHVPVVTAPAIDANGQMSIDPSESLSVVWSNGGVGEIHVTLGGSEGDVSRSIQCTAPSSQGSIVIDQSLLDGLSGTGALATVALASATGTQGDWGYSIVGQYNGPSRIVSFSP